MITSQRNKESWEESEEEKGEEEPCQEDPS